MLVRMLKQTIVGSTIYSAGQEYDIENDLADYFDDNALATIIGFGESHSPADNVARLSTDDNGNTVLLGADGEAVITLNSSGDILSSVIMRTDTMANLLAETAAGDGEIGVATDQNALVVFKGSPSEPVVYRPSPYVAYSSASTPSISGIASATATTVTIEATNLVDQAGIINATDDTITGLAVGDRLEVQFNVGITADSGGTYRKAWLEYEVVSTVWIALGAEVSETSIDGIYNFLIKASVSAVKPIRIRFQHDAGANRTLEPGTLVIQAKRPA